MNKQIQSIKDKILSYLQGEIEVSSLEEELSKVGMFHALASRELIKAMEILANVSVERDRVEAETSQGVRIELETQNEKVTEGKVSERIRLNPLWQQTELKFQMAKTEVDSWKVILRTLEVRKETVQFFLRSEIK